MPTMRPTEPTADSPAAVLAVGVDGTVDGLAGIEGLADADDLSVTTATAGDVTAERLSGVAVLVWVWPEEGPTTSLLGTVRAVDEELPVVVYAVDASPDQLAAVAADHHASYLPRDADADGSLLAGRVRTLAEVRRSREELALKERALDQAPVGITIADPDRPDMPLIYANEGFERTTGYDAATALGRNCRFLQGPGTDGETVREMRAAVRAEESFEVDVRNYRADGTEFWNQLQVSPVRDDAGAVTHYFGYQKDITERKEAELSLARQNERLEAVAGVLSHDLRNPLSVAQGHLELVMEDADGPAREHAEEVAVSLERMEQIVADALALARARNVEVTATVGLAAAAEDAWDGVETGEATLSVEGDLQFAADASMLANVLENLFRNAVEHGSTSPRSQAPEDAVEHGSTSPPSHAREDAVEHAGPSPAVAVGPLADGDGFYVADDGPGIPPEDRAAVFDLGYTDSDDGTGLGLGIVREVAEAHGWSVAVEESESGGARFEVSGVEPA